MMLIWIVYFLAAWGFCYIAGMAQISHGLRVLLGGIPPLDAQPPQYMVDVSTGTKTLLRPALPAREAVPAVIPVVGPWVASLLECPMCLGFWVGVAASFWLPVLVPMNPVLWSLIVGCATSGANFCILHFSGATHV